MTFEGLERFVQLVRYLNYSLASEELFMSQSALSRQIMSLEQELGCKLVAHTGRKISLTESGEIFYKYAVNALKQYAAMRTQISNIENDSSGHIRIGYTTEGHRELLHRALIEDSDEQHAYAFIKCNTIESYHKLIDKKIDCFICHRIVIDSVKDNVNIRQIVAGKLVLCVAERNQLSRLQTIKGSELTKLNSMFRISFDRSLSPESYDFFNRFLERYHVLPVKTIELDDFESYILNIETTNGFCMGSAIEPAYPGYPDIPIDAKVPEMDLLFVSRKDDSSASIYQLDRLYYSIVKVI